MAETIHLEESMNLGKNWTIGTRLWLLTAFMLSCLGIVGTISVVSSQTLSANLMEATEVQLPAIQNMTLVDMMHDGIRANVYRSIVASGSKDVRELKEVAEEAAEFAKKIGQYLEVIDHLPLDGSIKGVISAAKPELDAYVTSSKRLVEVALAGKKEEALGRLPEFQQKFESLEERLEKLGTLVRESAQTAGKSANLAADRSKFTSVVVMLLSLVVGLGFSALTIIGLRRGLAQMIAALSGESQGVAGTAVELSRTANGLTDSATKQASALQETAASLDEISAMVRKTSENSGALERASQQNHESASVGESNTVRMLEAIESINESNGRIVTQIEHGNQKIAEIVQVISEIGNKTKVINDIVFQTKLLSFNASVEAARAGEHGKGFAVVAEEVGNLAQMSGNAAKEISDLLESSVRTVNSIVTENKSRVGELVADGRAKLDAGKVVSRDCKESLVAIVGQSKQVSHLITEINTAIHEQTQGIQEISKALGLLDQNAHNNSETSRRTSVTSAGLLERSEKLLQVVEQLQALSVGGGASAGQARPNQVPPQPIAVKRAA